MYKDSRDSLEIWLDYLEEVFLSSYDTEKLQDVIMYPNKESSLFLKVSIRQCLPWVGISWANFLMYVA